MQAPPVPHNEAQRLQRLHELGVLDTASEAVLDSFTQLAAVITGMPIALISLIDNDRQWFKSAVGLPQGGQTPREVSFCGHAIAGDEVFEVEDARGDPRFADNPFVVGGPHVTHYAGAPLVMPGGERIGTLCVVDDKPGRLDERSRQLLRTLACSVVRVLLLRESERNLGEQVRAEVALRESEARFRTITDAMPQMVWSARPDGRHDYFNRRWYDFTGLDPRPGPDDRWHGLLHPDHRQATEAAWQRSVASGEPYEHEYLLRHHSGDYRWILGRALPVRDDAQRLLRWMGTSTDIHDQKLALEALEDANQRKDEFLAMLAHELRNPLAPISTAAQLLRMTAQDPQRVRQSSELISRQVEHMTELVDDLLDVSRVTRGLVRIDHEPVDLRQVVQDALEQSRPPIEARLHTVELSITPEPAWVSGDRVRLVQVLGNLLNNAAKYTPEGGRIRLALALEGPDSVLRVSDDGNGIDAQLLPHVFELFTQAKRTPDRAQGGLGLGLALVRSLVQLHGGRVEASSAGRGRGSTFTVRLPRIRPPSGVTVPPPMATQGQAIAPAPAPLAGAGALRVMVVDDNADAAELMGVWLEAQGHRVTVQTDPHEALAAAHREPAQVYVLDIGLPGMDGNALARRLRADPRNQRATLIALTGYGQAQDILQSRESGFDHHFVKPADPQRLAAVMETLSGQPGPQEGGRAPAGIWPAREESNP